VRSTSRDSAPRRSAGDEAGEDTSCALIPRIYQLLRGRELLCDPIVAASVEAAIGAAASVCSRKCPVKFAGETIKGFDCVAVQRFYAGRIWIQLVQIPDCRPCFFEQGVDVAGIESHIIAVLTGYIAHKVSLPVLSGLQRVRSATVAWQ
jgi:hypothetical protein